MQRLTNKWYYFWLLISALLSFTDSMVGQEPLAEAEAENGVLLGVSVRNSNPGYSGTGYVGNFANNDDILTMSVTLDQASLYQLHIRYGSFSGSKYQTVLINGEQASNIHFPATSQFETINAGTYYFKKGENTVSVRKDWGFMEVDKIEIHKAEEHSFDIEKDLVNYYADKNATSLYEFLKSQFGERIISGQTISNFDNLSNIVGETPMLKVGDLSSYTEGYPYLWRDGGHTLGAHDDGTVSELINWHNSTSGKGLVSLQWHWHSPSGGEPSNNNFYTDFTSFDVREAVKPGTDENILIIRDIDAIAVQLQRFEDAGVPILWRPLHEAGGGWFWWGAKGAEACLKLYSIIYERITLHHKINNLIWVWSTPEAEWYPGNHLVDIIGHDSYPGENNYGAQRYWFDKLYEVSGGEKLIAMTENGPIPDIDQCFDYDVPWLYFMSWSNLVEEQNETTHLNKVFEHDSVLKISSSNAIWRSSLYPDTWYPGYKDAQGRFYHDFSYAGYHQGEDSIPHISQNIVDVTLSPYFADNTGSDDVTLVLQQAIEDVGSAGGGVVYLPEGKYRVRESSTPLVADAALHIEHDSVVLRGAGPDKTYIFHDQATLRQKSVLTIRRGWQSWATRQGSQSLVREDLPDPTHRIPLESVDGFKVGDMIILRNTMTTAFAKDHLMEGIWDGSWIPGVIFMRRIDSIDVENNLIYIDIPTRYYLLKRDNARVYHAGDHIKECGVEHLSFGNKYNTKSGWGEEDYSTSSTGAYDAHGSHVIYFKYAQDCWVKNVATYKPEVNLEDIHVLSNCLLIDASRNISVDSCDFQKPQYEGGGGNGYMYTLSSNDCLIKNSRANHSRHNYDFKMPYSNGNVILKCKGENSKYSSDFHMYLSMANLFDGFISNGDYLECAFRPYGGSVLHGYPSTQSVFYNTYGEAYHPNRSYVVDTRQFDWGYVTGTSGPANNIRTTPVSGTQGGFAYNTSPEDFVEGKGMGSTLRPISLYLDQFERRQSGYVPRLITYSVEVEVKSAFNDNFLTGAEVLLHDTIKITGETGKVLYRNLPASFSYSATKEGFLALENRRAFINSDTVLRISLQPYVYDVGIKLTDAATGNPFWGASVFIEEDEEVTDGDGIATFELPSGTFAYRTKKTSFHESSGEITISSDTLIPLELYRSEAYMKFKLYKEGSPVNNAFVRIDADSVKSNNLGISLFEGMEINTNYNYTVRKEDFKTLIGEVVLNTDSTIVLEMMVDSTTSQGLFSLNSRIKVFPNPATDQLLLNFSSPIEDISMKILDLQGRVVYNTEVKGELQAIDIKSFHPGIYCIHLVSGKLIKSHVFVKN